MRRQAELAIKKADLILFIVDVTQGIMPQDRALAAALRKTKKPVLLTANKADNPRARRLADEQEWLKLSFGPPMAISAANGTGVGDLLDELEKQSAATGLGLVPLPKIDLHVAIIGRPNVGKSTLLNALAGEDRSIVSEVPHTTKEPQDTLVTLHREDGTDMNILLIDTVGIRKRAHVETGLESMGVRMSLGEAARADVIILIIDAAEGMNQQEKRLAGFAAEKKRGLLIVVNKWDLAAEKKLGTAEDFSKYLSGQAPFLEWVPLVFVSAANRSHTNKILEKAIEVATQRQRVLTQEVIDAFMEKLKKTHHASFGRGENRPHVYGMTQAGSEPPIFMMVVKDKETLHPNFMRFVENRLRDEFGFEGTPIRVLAREIDG